MRFAVRQDTFKPCILPIQVSYEHLHIKYLSRIYLLSLFQNDRDLLYARYNIKLVHLDFNQDFFVMLFTEYLRFTAMTNNKDCAVFSLIARSLFMKDIRKEQG